MWHWLFSDGVGWLAALTGVLGTLTWLSTAAVYRNKKMLAAGAVMALLSACVLSGICEYNKARCTLAINEARYSVIVDEVMASPAKWDEVPFSDTVTVDTSGGGIRIAFDLGAGFIDDFKSIVYDERGDVMKPREPGLDPDMPLGGAYGNVRHLRGNWYFLYLYPD